MMISYANINFLIHTFKFLFKILLVTNMLSSSCTCRLFQVQVYRWHLFGDVEGNGCFTHLARADQGHGRAALKGFSNNGF